MSKVGKWESGKVKNQCKSQQSAAGVKKTALEGI